MAIKTGLEILTHLKTELEKITVANGYNNDVKSVDREYRQRSYDEYPFIFINDIDSKYLKRICKDLYKKALVVQIAGFVYDDRANTDNTLPELGTTLQKFKQDVTKCLGADTYFNTSDIELTIIEVYTKGLYRPPQASFVCNVLITHFEAD